MTDPELALINEARAELSVLIAYIQSGHMGTEQALATARAAKGALDGAMDEHHGQPAR